MNDDLFLLIEYVCMGDMPLRKYSHAVAIKHGMNSGLEWADYHGPDVRDELLRRMGVSRGISIVNVTEIDGVTYERQTRRTVRVHPPAPSPCAPL